MVNIKFKKSGKNVWGVLKTKSTGNQWNQQPNTTTEWKKAKQIWKFNMHNDKNVKHTQKILEGFLNEINYPAFSKHPYI